MKPTTRVKMSLLGANAGRLALLMLLMAAMVFSPPRAAGIQTTFTNIVSYRVNGTPNYADPGNESLWSGIGWTKVPLVASVSPGGGQTPNVLVRSANDGFNIYVLFRWNDSQGPSYGASSEMFMNSTTQSLQDLDPAHTADVNQLFYNSTYYYQDRLAMLWFIADKTQLQTPPAMQLGTNGSITMGAGNIWHWQSVPTDNNPEDTDFPGGYTDPSGNAIFPPNNVSFAENDYTNTTGFFLVGGNAPGLSSLDPSADPYVIRAGNSFSPTNKAWTVEMVRSFTVSEAAKYQVSLTTGSSCFVAFAVWNGRMGESSHIKSVSPVWYNFTISNQSPSLPPPPVAGITPTLAVAAGAGLLIAGLIVGIAVRPRTKEHK